MTQAAQATHANLTCISYRVSGGELAVTARPGFAPVYRLCGRVIDRANALRKLA